LGDLSCALQIDVLALRPKAEIDQASAFERIRKLHSRKRITEIEGGMNKILVTPRGDREIGWELGNCMGCLKNAGVLDYTARLEDFIVFCVADRMLAKALKALVDAGFNAVSRINAE
jgi:hypothetical protein